MRALRNVEEMENQKQNCKILDYVLGFDEVSTDGTHCCPGKRFGNEDTCMEKYFNKTNHARYGTYYVQQLHHLKTVYPGMKPLLEGKGLSVQAQNFPFVQASTDQRGGQTIN